MCKKLPFFLLVAALLIVIGCAPVATPGAAPFPAQTPIQKQKSVSLEITAHNDAFDSTLMTVPAGAAVSLTFKNDDAGIPHNIAIYQNLSGGQTTPVFVGETITGPSSVTYRFTAPAAIGSYFFECDVHPDRMNGVFIITGT